MSKSLLFIPDISGFTKFVQSTEIEHSQHVISELLEVIINSITIDLKLAEIEGDALFFYSDRLPKYEDFIDQIESCFTAFYSHLSLLEKNRICPCNACSSAPKLELKIICHVGELEFINIKGNSKPFGNSVIEVHRLLKNSIDSDHYLLVTDELNKEFSNRFDSTSLNDIFNGKKINYQYTVIDRDKLTIHSAKGLPYASFDFTPQVKVSHEITSPIEEVFEKVTNYKYRHLWIKGVDKFEYKENEVNRLGTEHACVINDKHLNIIAVQKKVDKNKLNYGEVTNDAPFADKLSQFYTLEKTKTGTKITLEAYLESKSIFKKILTELLFKRILKKAGNESLKRLETLFQQ